MAGPAAAAAVAGQADWADPPYLTLSTKMPASVAALPVFGTIDWSLEALPFIDDGPTAGISGAALVHTGGALYMSGGFLPAATGDGSGDVSARTSRWTYRYDTTAKVWQKLADMPKRAEYTRGAVLGGEIYIVGGGTQRGSVDRKSYAPSAAVMKLSDLEATPMWTTHSQLRVPRTHPAVGVVGNYLIAAGGNEYRYDAAAGVLGIHSTTLRDTNEVFDVTDPAAGWQPRAPIPTGPRGWAASATVGGEFFVFGGLHVVTRGHDGGQVRMKLKDTLAYNPHTNQWTERSPVPFAISGWEADVFQDRYVILTGGIEADIVSPERMGANTWNDMAFVYDTVDDVWMRFDGLLRPGGVYNDVGVVVVGDTIYALGGEGPQGSHFDNLLTGAITLATVPEPATVSIFGVAVLSVVLPRPRNLTHHQTMDST